MKKLIAISAVISAAALLVCRANVDVVLGYSDQLTFSGGGADFVGTFGAAAAATTNHWQPISNLTLRVWYDAQDATTIVHGTGAKVASWGDKSLHGNNAVQATGDNQPSETAESFNGKNAIMFGASLWLQCPITVTGPFTFVTVSTNGQVESGQWVYWSFNDSRNLEQWNWGMSQRIYDGGAWRTFSTDNTPYFISSLVFYDNETGCGGYNGTTNMFDFRALLEMVGLRIGSAPDAAGPETYYLPGVMGEFLLFDSALSVEDRQYIEGYCAYKWGLQAQLPASHPYKNTVFVP